MNPFQYVTAGSPDEAVSLIGKNGRYLAGGIDLLEEMKDYIVSPDVLVNVKNVDLQEPSKNADRLPREVVEGFAREGRDRSNTRVLPGNMILEDIIATTDLRQQFPGLAEAAGEVGSPQIRNVATLAGNLLQHSRCWYYRQPDIVCLKRGGKTCYGQEGENKYLALFSGCACISPVVSNLATILTALDAHVVVQKSSKVEVLTMKELYRSAWTDVTAHHSLKPSDFLLSVIVPLGSRSAYRQVSEKSEFDWALVSCAAAGNVTGGKITDARVALGAVAPVPYMVAAAHHYLEGKPLTDETASQAADIILKDAKPFAQNGYKVPLAHALIRRTLLALNP